MSRITVGSLLQGRGDYVLFGWTIPKLESGREHFNVASIESPDFTFLNCLWYFKWHTNGISLHLRDYADKPHSRADISRPEKTVICTFGIMNSDGGLEEEDPVRHTFGTDGDWSLMCEDVIPDRCDLLDFRDELLPEGDLTVTCRLMKSDGPHTLAEAAPNLTGLKKLSSGFGQLLTSKKKCDAVLNVKGKAFDAHQIVLIAQSPVFAAMFEHDTSESQTKIVPVQDCDPDSFGDFLRYLYTGEFDCVTAGNAHHLYAAADKYDVQELKSFCVEYMIRNLTVDNVIDVVSMADLHDEAELMCYAMIFFIRNHERILSTTGWKTLLMTNSRLAKTILEKNAKAQIIGPRMRR